MTTAAAIKPTHKAVQAYYEALAKYQVQDVGHESALRSAFQNLLAETGKLRNWTLVPELAMRVRGKLVRPDGTTAPLAAYLTAPHLLLVFLRHLA